MKRDDLDSLAPGDGALALRTFPRRYREAFRGERAARAGEVGPRGDSALDLVADTVRALPALERALEQVLTGDDAVLNASLFDPDTRTFESRIGSLDDELEDLAAVSSAFADRVDRVTSADWNRDATLTGGGRVTAIEILREAVGTGADNLRTIDVLLVSDR